MALASSNSFLTSSFLVRWYSAIKALMRRTWRFSASCDDDARVGGQGLDLLLDQQVLLLRAQVREIVVPPVDDPGVGLAVVRVDDDVDAPHLGLEDRSTTGPRSSIWMW